MTSTLILSPDYASHYLPLSAVATSLQQRGHEVVVATGPGLRSRVLEDGFRYRSLVLGPGTNPGIVRPEKQAAGEDRHLEDFFSATKSGMVPTLLYQAHQRLRDLLWEPDNVAARIGAILDGLRPQVVIVDQIAFTATAALRGLQHRYVSFLPGHPSAIPSATPYGYPPAYPSRFSVEASELHDLKSVCEQVQRAFTAQFNEAVARINPQVPPVVNAFATTSDLLTLVNYPRSLGAPRSLPNGCHFIGSSVRAQSLPREFARRLNERRHLPRIYVSLGSFFSVRRDILRKLVAAFRNEAVDVVMAAGATDIRDLGALPEHWIVEPYIPQPATLPHCDLVVTHGGNNTVTEALTAGVPMLVGPLSTDQFAGAADLEAAGVGAAFDPNRDSAGVIGQMARRMLTGPAGALARQIGRDLRAHPGQERAADLIEMAIAGSPSVITAGQV